MRKLVLKYINAALFQSINLYSTKQFSDSSMDRHIYNILSSDDERLVHILTVLIDTDEISLVKATDL